MKMILAQTEEMVHIACAREVILMDKIQVHFKVSHRQFSSLYNMTIFDILSKIVAVPMMAHIKGDTSYR